MARPLAGRRIRAAGRNPLAGARRYNSLGAMGQFTTIAALAAAAAPPGGEAAALLERSLEAHGGMAAIEAAPAIMIELEGRTDLAARGQGRRFDAPEWTPIAERIGIERGDGAVAYEIDGFNYTFSHQRLREVHRDGPLFLDLRAGTGAYLPFTLADDAKDRYRRHLPQFLLADALERRETLRAAGEKEFRGCDAEAAEYETEAGDRLLVYVERSSGLVCGAAATIDMPVFGREAVHWRWSDYSRANGAALPGRFESWIGGRPLKVARMTVRFGAEPPAFEAPAGVDTGDPPETLRRLADLPPAGARPPRVEEVAEGVHMIQGLRPGFRTPFIEFDDFVLVADAPSGYHDIQQIPPLWGSPGDAVEALGEKIVRAVRETVPGKPIRYVALTHHHGDHIGGLAPLVRAGATVLASGPVAPAARRISPAARIETFSGERTIADAGMEVRLIELPPGNPKAEGFTLIYLPRRRFLYSTAFLYPVGEGEAPPPESVELSLWFLDWLDRSGLEVETHYNVHAGGLVEPRHVEALRRIAAERRSP